MTLQVTAVTRHLKPTRLAPILKWVGGKEKELKYIHPALPPNINKYYEPFIGGGAVFFSVDVPALFINDKSHELVNLYKIVAQQDKDFFNAIETIIRHWKRLDEFVIHNQEFFLKQYTDFSSHKTNELTLLKRVHTLIATHRKTFCKMFVTPLKYNQENFLVELHRNILSKMKRMKKIETLKGKLSQVDILHNIEAALKSAFYMHIRHLYNHIKAYHIPPSPATALFFFIRNYAYSDMYRYNTNGHFNVPYGGIGYNRKDLLKKVKHLKSKELVHHLCKTTIENLDFEDFLKKNQPTTNDFIFLDPPYDSEFSTYAQNTFTKSDQKRLANYLLHNCRANWMLVIKHTDFIYNLYKKHQVYISSFSKKYLVSFQNRNNKDAEHLIITSYAV